MTSPRRTLAPLVFFPFAVLALTGCAVPAVAQRPATAIEAAAPAPPYADLADLVVASPLVVDATIRSAARIKGAEAAGLAPGSERYYVEADVGALVRGSDAIPARVGWLVDVAPDANGRIPKLKKQRVLAFARRVEGMPGQVQLIAPGAQLPWNPTTDALARRIATEATATDAPPIVTGVRSAFHVPGALPGEGETQIFLTTQEGRPAAVSVLRRPGETPRWSVALSEIIDENAVAPARDTLLWYRLACALPAALPAEATRSLEAADAEQAAADYRYVIEALGPCRGAATPVSDGGVSG